MKNELIQVIESNKLEKSTGDSLQEHFLPFFQQAKEWKEKAEGLIVTSVEQKREMNMAREARLALREIRINADKTRKALKQDSIRYGRAVQGVYNVIEYLVKPIEEHLHEQEKFAEIKEAERKAKLKAEREDKLNPFSEFVPIGVDLANMQEEDYKKLLNGAKLQFQAKIEAERKAEQERIAKEKAEAEERERIRKENEFLKAEAEKREAEIKAEREKREAEQKAAEAKTRKEREAKEAELKAEREAKAKLEAEIKAKKEAERKAEADRLEAERKAKSAPDRDKLIELANRIKKIDIPELSTAEAKKVLAEADGLLNKVSAFIYDRCKDL